MIDPLSEKATALAKRLNWVWGELMQYRETHEKWVTHLEHCASCPDCQSTVVAQVGSLEKHRNDVETYTAMVDVVRDAAESLAALRDVQRDIQTQLEMERQEFTKTIWALKGALGYSVPGQFGEEMADGTRPINGIAEALERQLRDVREYAYRLGVRDTLQQDAAWMQHKPDCTLGKPSGPAHNYTECSCDLWARLQEIGK